MDTLKQEKKTTSHKRGEKCDIHGCDLEQLVKGERGWNWDCPVCLDLQEKEKSKARIISQEQEQIRQAHHDLCVPARFKESSFSNYIAKGKVQISKNVCEKFVTSWPNAGGGLMLGGVGTGKTHLAYAMCKGLCDKGVSCCMTSVNKIVRHIRSAWGGGKKISGEWAGDDVVLTETDIIRQYNSYGLLVIDEIGSQYGTDSERIIINEIINNRYEQMLPTIVIGNLSISETKDILGDRVVDRLRHDGFLLVFDWESHRG